MIGIIVTGHGNFATGVSSALHLITGQQENYETVDFVESDGVEDLRSNLKTAISKLEACETVLVFSDLVGGSPFKTAVEISLEESKKITVLGGTNLGMLIECVMSRNFIDDVQLIIQQGITAGKDQILKYEFVERKEEEVEEGI
ncbi:MAG: PTS galactosamine/N-acetylgalactosamine transporter subunit IIA [Anaerorhabdus sp.]